MRLAGVYELAHKLGITKQCLDMRRKRQKDFPAPLQQLKMSPIWDLESPEMMSYFQAQKDKKRKKVGPPTS